MPTSTLHDPAGVLAVGVDSVKLIKSVGVLGALAVVFAESGLLIGASFRSRAGDGPGPRQGEPQQFR